MLGIGLVFFGVIHLIGYQLVKSGCTKTALVHIVKDFNTMPKTMVQLAVVQFFSWFALFSMWIYTTTAVTSHIYGSSDTSSKLYNEGADMVGNLFGGYNEIAAISVIGISFLAKKTSKKL